MRADSRMFYCFRLNEIANKAVHLIEIVSGRQSPVQSGRMGFLCHNTIFFVLLS